MQISTVFTFRPVCPTDLSIICSFPQGPQELYFMFPKAVYPLTPSQLQAAIDQRHEATVILEDDEVRGFANFNIFEPGIRCGIGNVIVSSEYRNHGIGRALVNEMVRKAFTDYDAQTVELSCFNENVPGLLFYPKLGFQPVSLDERLDWTGKTVVSIHFALSRSVWLTAQTNSD